MQMPTHIKLMVCVWRLKALGYLIKQSMECINTRTKINNTTPSHSENRLYMHVCAHTQVDCARLDRKCRQPPTTTHLTPRFFIFFKHDNSQPGAGVSFSVNGVNELEILLSLWASKMIQSGQISVRMKSVSARSPLHPLWSSCNFAVNSDWLSLCDSEIKERGLFDSGCEPVGPSGKALGW